MSFYGVRLIFVPNPSTMVHSEWAFLVHVYGNFHLQVALLLEETQNCPYRMIISNTSRYSISDYISASESRGPFVAQVCFDPVAETGSFRWATAKKRLAATPSCDILLDSRPSKKDLNVLLGENPKTIFVEFGVHVSNQFLYALLIIDCSSNN